MYWRIIENHPALRYIEKLNQEIVSLVDPLFEDEAAIQLIKNGKENYRFNKGHNKIGLAGYIAAIENVYVEPSFFLVIRSLNTIIKESIDFDWYNISFKTFVNKFIFLKYVKLNEAVLFNARSGSNVFHFYNDVLPKLFVAEKEFLNKPFLISEELYSSKIFQYYLSFDFVKKINWHIVKNNILLRVKKLYLIKCTGYDSVKLKFIADQTFANVSVSGPRNLKIFINRKEATGRTISNFKELEPVLTKNNFQILYLEDLDISKQIDIFSRANLIVGIHGAGLTNLIFSYRNSPTIIEITSSEFIPTHYYWLSQSMGLRYKLFLGEPFLEKESGKTFSIDIKRFSNILSSYC